MPVFSSHLSDYRGLGVGRQIREERRRKGLKLREISLRVGMSVGTVSNIETDKLSPDLAQLTQLARALEVSVAAFLPRSRVAHYFIRRTTDIETEAPVRRRLVGPEPGPAVHHNAAWPLADPFVGKHFEPVRARVAPLADADLHFIAHDHEEFMFVLQGEVETQLKTDGGLVIERLRAGDCIYFRSNLPHCHRSTSTAEAETINVMYSLRGPIDPHDGELESFGRRFYRRGVYEDAAREASEKIGLLRRSHGLTLSELSAEVGIGSRLLADIESGARPADLDLLLRFARRFRRPIEYFFGTTLDSQHHYFIQRASELAGASPWYWTGVQQSPEIDKSRQFRSLAVGFPERGLHPYYMQLMSEPMSSSVSHQAPGQQFIYVLEGDVKFVTGADRTQVEQLRPGDSIFLDTSIPHELRANSRNPYAAVSGAVLVVYWTPLRVDDLFRCDN